MPVPLGEIHNWLYNEVAWLHIKWADFRRLYATSQERIDLLNAAAPAFFHHLQRMMWEGVLLHLCRITDHRKSMGHANLTIMRIPDAIPDLALRSVVKPLVNDAMQKTQFARDLRNRQLAHRELPPFQGQVNAPLATISHQNVEDALAAVRKAMNHIEQHYLNESVLYEHSIESLGGVESLVARLTTAIHARKVERERNLG